MTTASPVRCLAQAHDHRNMVKLLALMKPKLYATVEADQDCQLTVAKEVDLMRRSHCPSFFLVVLMDGTQLAMLSTRDEANSRDGVDFMGRGRLLRCSPIAVENAADYFRAEWVPLSIRRTCNALTGELLSHNQSFGHTRSKLWQAEPWRMFLFWDDLAGPNQVPYKAR